MAFNNEYDYFFKVTFLGDRDVGKTSIILRFADDIYSDNKYTTMGVDYKIRTIYQDGKDFRLKLWDGTVQSQTYFYQDTHGVFICYSIDNQTSFDHATKWLDDVDKYAPEGVVKFLLGCKSDLSNRCVPTSEGQSLASRFNIPFMEISSKNSTNIEQTFSMMALNIRKVVDSKPKTVASSSNNASTVKGKSDEKSKKCIIC